MEANLVTGTGPEQRRSIAVEDEDYEKNSFEEEMQLYICKQKS